MSLLRRSLLLSLALAMFAAACTVAPPAQSERTIAGQLLSDSGDDAAGYDADWYDFDIVTNAVLLFPDLVEAASDPSASLTAFLPNDRAFQVLIADLTGEWLWTESEVFDAVAALGTDTVKTVLTYHLVGGAISAQDAVEANGASLTTLQGGEFTVRVMNPLFWWISLDDQDPDGGNPSLVFSKLNYGGELTNGYIHGISLVLRPVDL